MCFAPTEQTREAVSLCCTLLLLTVVFESKANPGSEKTFRVTGYEIRGNTTLAPGEMQTLFTNATGPAVSLSQICMSVASLRTAYVGRGLSNVVVTVPQQQIANGIVRVDICENLAGHEEQSPPASAVTNRPSAPKFEVRQFAVTGNTLLSSEEISQSLAKGVGPGVTLDDVRTAAMNLQRAYRDRGYVTVAVTLPSQRLTNATVRLEVTESPLTATRVVGNRHFSSNNVLRAFPSLTNTPLNNFIFQRELDLANQNRDRQIYPMLGPGPDVGTSEMVLRVKDRLPLHGHLELDNYSTPGTPDLRANAAVQYNNLWQLDHQAGLSYSFSPEELKTMGGTPNFGFNQPLISSYSGFYRIPFRTDDTLQIRSSPNFGYQESTHQFRLPPVSSGAEATFYASAFSADTGVKWGDPSVVSQDSLQTIVSRDSGENLTESQNGGAQLRFPITSSEHFRWSGFIGADVKHTSLTAVSTNNFFITTVTTNAFGAQTNGFVSPTPQPRLHAEAYYFPINGGLDVSETDANGASTAEIMLVGNPGSSGDFSKLSYTDRARVHYAKAILSASRDQKLPAGCSILTRLNAQGATGALISNEQFALGGVNSVRGYFEGDQYGDAGWNGSVELRSRYFVTEVAGLTHPVPVWIRGYVFTDWGQRVFLENVNGSPSSAWLCGTGVGLSANVNNHLDARLIVAWPLLRSVNTPPGEPHAYFSIGGQF